MAKVILVLGAGRSSGALITYLLKGAATGDWRVVVGDVSEAASRERVAQSQYGRSIAFDIHDKATSIKAIATADVVISLLPAALHSEVAKVCLELKKHLLTASYVSDEMIALDGEARKLDLLFLNECGLDPGIDHMSAMQVIEKIKAKGGKITSFESFTGGLIAPETDLQNPWRYKFTWNARNVILAGQSTAKYLLDGEYKYIPYQQLFRRIRPVHVEGYGEFEGYANRDSLRYIDTYGLSDIRTMLRGTLRNKGFCEAWNIFVQLGCCDDSYMMEGVRTMTHRKFLDAFLPADNAKSVKEKLEDALGNDLRHEAIKKLEWSGMFDDVAVGLDKGTPAQILEHILNKKWELIASDKDLIVMWHRFVYEREGKRGEIHASLASTGSDSIETAMAKTVGLPLGVAAKLLLEDKIKSRGVRIPVTKEFYEPILEELKAFGIELIEREISI